MSRAADRRRQGVLLAILGLLVSAAGADAQDHSQHHPPPAKAAQPAPSAPNKPPASDTASPVDHAAMGHAAPVQGEHAEHTGPRTAPREPIPALTDADRAAAFPEIRAGHAAHDHGLQTFLQLEQLEAWQENDATGLAWEARGWAGGDVHRLWLRSEGERFAGDTEGADLEVLYGRAVSRWWDLVAGVQQDFSPGSSRTFAGIGVIGLAPYKFEVEATAYVGEAGQTRASLEAEYELLLTNRLILQPLVELTLHGEDDERRGIGAGLSTLEAGLRLRYEFTRRFAPYVGVVYERAFSTTADFRRAEGEEPDDTQVVAGVRTWF